MILCRRDTNNRVPTLVILCKRDTENTERHKAIENREAQSYVRDKKDE